MLYEEANEWQNICDEDGRLLPPRPQHQFRIFEIKPSEDPKHECGDDDGVEGELVD